MQNNGWCLPIAPTQQVDVEDMSPTTKKSDDCALDDERHGGKSSEKTSLLVGRRIFIFFTISVSVQVFIYITQKKQSTIL
jgi:hypothetical protein